MTVFVARAGTFEGPLDALLTLIEERKLLISDVSLASVADSFVTFVKGMADIPVEETAHFIHTAATLLLIKSRALLPNLELSEEEAGDIENLEQRLKILQAVRAATGIFGSLPPLLIGEGVRDSTPVFVVPGDMTLVAIEEALVRVLQSAPKQFAREEVTVAATITLDQMIERLTSRIERTLSMSFSDFTASAADVREIVVSFLAMLELVKVGVAEVDQGAHFTDITIHYKGEAQIPKYD